MEEDFVSSDEAMGDEDNSRRRKIMIGVGVTLVVCCLCVAVLAAGWFYGDVAVDALGL